MNRQEGSALIESVWNRIREHLQNERHRIYQEIKNYPPPIPACDAQFNYLLEERARIGVELARIEAIVKGSITWEEHKKSIEEFIMWSKYIDKDARQGIRSTLSSVVEGGA